MSITNDNTENTFIGDGLTTVFPTNIVAFTADQIYVYLRENSVDTLQTLTTHYTVGDLEDPAGVSVTFLTAPTSTQEVVVVRVTPKVQELILTSTRAYNPEVLMDQMDLLVMMVQELAKQQARTFRVKPGITAPTEIDDPAALADAVALVASILSGFGWDSKLTAIINEVWAADKLLYLTGVNTVGSTDLTTYMRTVLALASQAALRSEVLNTLMQSIANKAVVAGDLLVGNGASSVARLAIGSPRQLPVVNESGTGLEYVTGGRVRLGLTTISAGDTAVTLALPESNNYSFYEIDCTRVLPTTDATSLVLRVSTDGSAFDSGASDYATSRTQKILGSAEDDAGGGTAGSIILAANIGNAAGEQGFTGTIRIANQAVAARTTAMWRGSIFDATAGSLAMVNGVGARLANQIDVALRLIAGTGTLASGFVRLYGIP